MKRRLTMILAGLFLSIGIALAQTSVTGVVTSAEDGLPVVAATVKAVDMPNVATVTNVDGEFKLNVALGTKLEITYLGMKAQVVKAARNMRIVLEPDNQMIDEVMVVAYGTAKKSQFTGSAAVLGSEEIKKTADSNPVQALTGKVSGVQINQASGQPGNTDFNIKIRGISSINAGSQPLIIVDGAPFDGDLNALNNNDIASMTVLKDAASAALYGARGANGVILITTKNGKDGTSSITVDAKWGSNSRALPDYEYVTSPAAYYETWYSALKSYASCNVEGKGLGLSPEAAHKWANDNLINGQYGLQYNVYNIPSGQTLIGSNGKLNPNATLGNVINYNGKEFMLLPDSWADALYNNGLRQEYTITATGSNSNGSYYSSVNYLDNEGITYGSDYKRLNARLKADYKVREWMKVSGNFSYTHYDSNYLSGDGDSNDSGSLFAVRKMAPIYPLYVRDGKGNLITNPITGLPTYDYGDGDIIGISRPIFQKSNPFNDLQLETLNYEGNMLNAVGAAEIRFLKDFTFTSTNTAMVNEQRGTSLTQPFFGQSATYGGAIGKNHSRTWSYTYQQLLNWHHQYGKHNVEAMLGHEYYRARDYVLSASKTNIYSISNTELASAIIDGSMSSGMSDYNTEGYFGRAQYNYDTKYFGSFSYRRDASSRFHPDHRWGNFWSFGGAWLVSKEKWFNVEWVDELKLKASYGEQGNDNIPGYLYTDRFLFNNSNGNLALVPSSTKGNKNITWEKNANFNIGTEFSLFKGRLAGSIEYFNRKTSDMLAFFTLPTSLGFSGYYDNVGNMSNTGVEVELDGTVLRTKDLQWGINLNFTAYKNKITSMPDANKTMVVDGVGGYSNDIYFIGEGEEMYTFYLPKYAGVDPETGEALYYKDVQKPVLDENGQPVIGADGQPLTETVQETTKTNSSATRHLCGGAQPWAYGGFGTTFAYKGFDLSVDFTYQLGGKVYDYGYAGSMSPSKGTMMHVDALKAWTVENNTSNIPAFRYGDMEQAQSSDRFLIGASYLCLQNVNLGYTLPKNWIAKAGLTNVRLYVTGSNLWLWSKRQGMDPRQSITGASSAANYSPIRSISGGLTVSF